MRDSLRLILIAGVLLLGVELPVVSLAFAEDDSPTPDNAADPDYMAVKAEVDTGDYQTALTRLMALDQETPNDPDILNLIGFSLRKTGHPDQALGYYGRALAQQPDHLGANEYLGELYLELKQPEKAEERLAVLQQACGDCEEYRELKEKIAQQATN
ncbi:tetratricopeptide repeat protein [Dongia sp.]|uniref:tetratricopeptide repeat protein n=1 Tax=Dongia sp. TaxID=1977262 RepID=UPI003753A1A3